MGAPAGASHLNLTAGTLVAIGGIMGYAKKKSLPSLIAGCTFGALYMSSAYMINSDQVKNGFALGTGSGSLLVAAMLPRFIKTGSFMPAGREGYLSRFIKSGAFMPAGRSIIAGMDISLGLVVD